MPRIVVTGSSGFIGQHLCAQLRRDGHHVVGVDRLPPRPGTVTRAVRCDLAAGQDDRWRWLRRADAVIHLAGSTGVRTAAPDVEERRRLDNVVATSRLLAAVPLAVPVVVASSSSVYGGACEDVDGGWRASREDDPLRPLGGYARSKVAVERLCEARRAAGGRVAVVRPFTVAGEGQRPDMAIARWLVAASEGRALTVLGSPDRGRDVTDVLDVVEGIVRILERGVEGTVNLGTGRTWQLRRIIAAVAAELEVEPTVEVLPAATIEPPATRADTRRCERLLAWRPTTDIDELVARQAAAFTVRQRRAG